MQQIQEKPAKRVIDPKDSTFRLQAYFKPGGKQLHWKWNADWLLSYYNHLSGAKLSYAIDAVYRKIEEINFRCNRIIVYDNRPTTEFPVLIEIVNGRVVTDNRPVNEKVRRPLKLN